MKRVLIFGATGVIGAYTAIALKEKGYDVSAVGLRITDNGFFSDFGIKYFSVDIQEIRNFKQIEGLKPDVILHLAGLQPAYMKNYNPVAYIDSIVRGTLNVINYGKKENIDRILFTQTRADTSHLMGSLAPISESVTRSFPLKGDHSIYTISKNAAVDIIEHFYHSHHIKRFIFRLPTIYAYHPNKYFYVDGIRKMMAYRKIIEDAKKSKDIEIWGDPSRAKEITYIKDMVQILQKACDAKVEGGIYNVGRGVGVTLDEQIRGIVEVFSPTNNPSSIFYRPDLPNARQFVHDISKTIKDLEYEPMYDYPKLLNDFKLEMELNRFEKLWGQPGDYE